MTKPVHILRPYGTLTMGFRETACGSQFGLPHGDVFTTIVPTNFRAVEVQDRDRATCKRCLRAALARTALVA